MSSPVDSKGAITLVLPSALPDATLAVVQRVLSDEPILKAYTWIIDTMTDEKGPKQLTETYVDRYYQQIVLQNVETLEEYAETLRAGVLVKLLLLLPRFRSKFAKKGYNFVFLETWLREQILGALYGFSTVEVKRHVLESGQKPPQFLAGEVSRLLPRTCLAFLLG
jgi:hypothetical protein